MRPVWPLIDNDEGCPAPCLPMILLPPSACVWGRLGGRDALVHLGWGRAPLGWGEWLPEGGRRGLWANVAALEDGCCRPCGKML